MTIRRTCPVCEGEGVWTRSVFDAVPESCMNCGGTGKIDVEMTVTRSYRCDTCRLSFDSDFCVDPQTLEDMARPCPHCGQVGFLAIESVADLIRCHAIALLVAAGGAE